MAIQGLPHFSELQGYLTSESIEQKKEEKLFKELREIKNHSSGFTLIDKAIQYIPEGTFHSKTVFKVFNETIAGYSKLIQPFPFISRLSELEVLERQLEEYSLKKLWDSLWGSALVDLADKPEVQNIGEVRKWFENKQNQPLLDKVTVLSLAGCKMIQLPREIFKLPNLKELDLSENLIEVIPESVKIWKNLKRWNLCYNELKYLPHNGIKHLRNLQYLNVKANWLHDLPRSIWSLKNLRKLNLKENYLKMFPKEIGLCTGLKVLNVASNELSELHPNIKHLTSLKRFSAADNHLTYLPEGLENWKQIKKVKLSHNSLANFTQEFFRHLWPTATQISLAEQSVNS